jgi:hypothetical protein
MGIAITIGIAAHSTQHIQSIGLPAASLMENERTKVEITAITVTTVALNNMIFNRPDMVWRRTR